VRRDSAGGVELDDNVAIYDTPGQLLIMLNSSAAAVWERCDGATTLDEMVGELVEAHGGNVRFESELGRGSTFFVELPTEVTHA